MVKGGFICLLRQLHCGTKIETQEVVMSGAQSCPVGKLEKLLFATDLQL